MDTSHVNYARTGPGAVRGIVVLHGRVVAVDNSEAIISWEGPSGTRTARFYFDSTTDEWKKGQTVEITFASFDS